MSGVSAGLLDTHLALILIYASFQVPLVLLILRDFFGQVPKEISECAAIDAKTDFEAKVKKVAYVTKL